MWFSSWLRHWKRSTPAPRRRTPTSLRQRAGFRPRIEALEARWLPSLTVGPNVNMSKLLGQQAEASLAINPTNPNSLVAFAVDTVVPGIPVFVSNNAGATWTSQFIADGDGLGEFGCCDPQAAFDSYGNLFMTYLDIDGNQASIRVLLSTDGGASFSLLATLANKGDQPSIATGANSVWVSYLSFSGKIAAQGAAVTGLGVVGSFSHIQHAPESQNGNFGSTAIGPNGQVMVTYQAPVAGEGPSTIYTSLDSDGLANGGFDRQRMVTSTNVGGFDLIPAQPRRSIDAEANLAWDRSGGAHNGRVYLVYTDETVNENNDTDIFVVFSDNDGSTWSLPVRVHDDTGTNSQFMPQIAVDQSTGNIAVAWYDSRNAGAANDTAQVFATVSTDGGVTFEPNVLVSAGMSNAHVGSPFFNYGDYNLMEFVNGVFYPTWADNSNSTGDNPNGTLGMDIYTAKVTFTPEPSFAERLSSLDAPLVEEETRDVLSAPTLPTSKGRRADVAWPIGAGVILPTHSPLRKDNLIGFDQPAQALADPGSLVAPEAGVTLPTRSPLKSDNLRDFDEPAQALADSEWLEIVEAIRSHPFDSVFS